MQDADKTWIYGNWAAQTDWASFLVFSLDPSLVATKYFFYDCPIVFRITRNHAFLKLVADPQLRTSPKALPGCAYQLLAQAACFLVFRLRS